MEKNLLPLAAGPADRPDHLPGRDRRPDVTAALAPVLAEVAGLPGAPVRALQVAAAYPSGDGGPPQAITFGGQPPALRLSLGLLNMPGSCGFARGPWARMTSPARCGCCSPTPSRARAHRSATPWVWPTRPPHDRGGAICACLVIAAGLVLIAVRGPRESGRESGPAS
jgi:hypothetical protein